MVKTRKFPNSSSKELDTLLIKTYAWFRKTKFDNSQKDFINAAFLLIQSLTVKVTELIDQIEKLIKDNKAEDALIKNLFKDNEVVQDDSIIILEDVIKKSIILFVFYLFFQSKIIRVLNLWQKNEVFTADVIQPLFDLANPASDLHRIVEEQIKRGGEKENSGSGKSGKAGSIQVVSNNSNLMLSNENELDPSEQQIMSTIQGFLKNMPGHSSSSQINKKVLDFDYSDDEDGGGGGDFSEPTPQMIEALNSILNNEKMLTKLKNAGEITNNHIQQLQQLLPQHQPQHINQHQNFWGHQNMPSHPESSIWSNSQVQFHEKSIMQQQNISNSMNMQQEQEDEIQIVDDRNRDRSSRRSRSPRSDRKRSRSHRSRSRSRDRSGRSSRRRSRSRERDMDREKRREREKRGLPPVRKNHLSGKNCILIKSLCISYFLF